MYKRRKVFSKIGEKTFSTTEFQTQKEFAAKKNEESKKEKVAKAATIGGATIGLGAGAVGLGTEIGRKKVKKSIEEKTKEMYNTGGGIKAKKAAGEAIDKLKKNKKILEKVSKHAPKAALAGVGASVAAGTAYKLARKKNEEQKEFASVRAMKKQSKAIIDAASKKDIKRAGKIAARMNKQGLGKNSEKFLASEGSKKVYKGQVNKLAEIGGTKPSKVMKNLAVEELTTGAVNLGKQNIARGGKGIKLKS